MIIEIKKIDPDGSRYAGAEPAEILELAPGAAVWPSGPVTYDFFVQLAGPELVVQGTLQVSLEGRCGRCAGKFSTNLTVSDFLCARELPEGLDSVDLTGDIREEVLLRLPNYPLCLPDCRGLCPQCGKNLNQGPCRCTTQPVDSRWAGLENLKLPAAAGRK